ncbi:hypothetical protein [Kitasatospora sp. DSM 101779]|uniref:hypothetical protein n=1 Tax=Kitasatospora sp. DSM 101779 TaxID=2853165 RepID=UPI002952D5E7|nr:hypothetical protein [Kitasatospora sp. DSM 101779]
MRLSPSVNVVQSCFPAAQQGEISGLSRSISNLGSSLGTARRRHDPGVGAQQGRVRGGVAVLAVLGLGGLTAAFLLPCVRRPATAGSAAVAAPGAPQQQ